MCAMCCCVSRFDASALRGERSAHRRGADMSACVDPILYSFVRCPFAIRARYALALADVAYVHREVRLSAKPACLLQLSPKGTVPVLHLPDGTVIDESLDIMHFAFGSPADASPGLASTSTTPGSTAAASTAAASTAEAVAERLLEARGQHPEVHPDGAQLRCERSQQLGPQDATRWPHVGARVLPLRPRGEAIIARCDGPFKKTIDRYKYWVRHKEQSLEVCREDAARHVAAWEQVLAETPWLAGDSLGFVDVAVFPFVRQFSRVDPPWFEDATFPCVRNWLQRMTENEVFASVMVKHPVWKPGDAQPSE